MKPSHRKAKSSSPPIETSTETSWWGRFLMSTASLAASSGSSPGRRTSSILYSWTERPPLRTFSTPASISSGSMADMKPTLPRFTPSRTRPGYILAALSIVPSPPSTKTRSGSTAPSGSPCGLTSATSTPPFSSAATSRPEWPSSTFGFATTATRRTSPMPSFSGTRHDPAHAPLIEDGRGTFKQPQRVLLVAGLAARNSRRREVYGAEAEVGEGGNHAEDRAGPNPRVAHNPAAPHEVGPGLELGLHEHDRLPQRWRRRDKRPQRDPERDKREVRDEQVGPEREVFAL